MLSKLRILTVILSTIIVSSCARPCLKPWNEKDNTTNRFEILASFNNEAVLDHETGLVWERSPSTEGRIWVNAMADCYKKNIGGRLGWRLPAIEEIASLVDPSRSEAPYLPAGHPFNIMSGGLYYSSTLYDTTPTNVWVMRPYDGSIRVNIINVPDRLAWCVRGGYGHEPDKI